MCWLFHKWNKWVNITIEVTDYSLALQKSYVSNISGQERYCLKCNKKEVRRVKTQ